MKKFIFILGFLVIAATVFSQNYQDVVYLKNGSVIKGTIMEQVPDKTIKIKSGENLFVYQMDEIEKITKEEEESKSKKSLLTGKSELIKGYQLNLELGVSVGRLTSNTSMIARGNVVNGYRFNPYISTGLGIGLRAYEFFQLINGNSNSSTATLLPVFADVRINFLDRKVSPYSATGLGYSYDLSDQLRGVGSFISQSFGATFKVSTKSSFNVGLCLEWQRGPDYNSLGILVPKEKIYSSVGFVVGFSF